MRQHLLYFGLFLGVSSLTSMSASAQGFQDSFADIIKEAQVKQTGTPLPKADLPEANLPDVPMPDNLSAAAQNPAEETLNTFEDATPSATALNAVPPSPDDVLLSEDFSTIDGFVPSYGGVNLSVMFSESDMVNMRKILRFYEGKEKAGAEDQQLVDEYDDYISQIIGDIDEEQSGGEVAPIVLPAYYLGTILYRGTNKWTIWLNGKKFGPKDEIQNLRVIDITPNTVRFIWTPDRLAAASTIHDANKTSGVRKYKNRSAQKQSIAVDIEKGEVRFTLGRNQTFNAADMEIFEGKFVGGVDPFTLQASNLEPETTEDVGANAAENTVQRRDPDRELMDSLLESTKNIQNISIPQRGINSSETQQ